MLVIVNQLYMLKHYSIWFNFFVQRKGKEISEDAHKTLIYLLISMLKMDWIRQKGGISKNKNRKMEVSAEPA